MDLRVVQNIRKNIESKSTEELIQIWKENDRSQYSDEAFEAIRQLLEEQGVATPLQNLSEKSTNGISQRYPALQTIAGICKILAYLNAISAVVGGFYFVATSGITGIFILISSLFLGAIAFVILYAISELIHVFIDIEENTRKVSILIKGGV